MVDALVTRRSTYDKKTKASILNLIGEATGASAVKRLKCTQGFEKVTPTMVRKWRTPGPSKRRGKKVNLEFEAQIIGQMIYTEFENVNGVELAIVKANVAHSYAVIQRAAEMVQALPQFKEDDKVQKLKFSRYWVRGFLRRAALRRRRVTATEKIPPPVAEVRAKMLETRKLSPTSIWRSGLVQTRRESFLVPPPKNQYIPKSADRATAPESDDKTRFTSLLWGTAAGWMGPLFNIIKMSVKGADLSSSRVLQNLQKVAGFGASDGWELRIWCRTLTLRSRATWSPRSS